MIFFEKDNPCEIHDRNLLKLVTEIFEVKNEFSSRNSERGI